MINNGTMINNRAAINPDAITAAPRGLGLVLVVLTPNGQFRRRAFLTIGSAERALARAIDAGKPASLIVCQLVPLAIWDGRTGGLDE